MSAYVPDLLLVVVVAVLVASGIFLMLERSLSRVAIGMILVGNGVNVMFLLTGGPSGGPPIVGLTPESEMSDPLPQAMVLTAIVISLSLTAFLLAMAYRSWQLYAHDEVQDDLEDRRIARIATMGMQADESGWVTLDEEAIEARDETADIVEEHWLAEDQDEVM